MDKIEHNLRSALSRVDDAKIATRQALYERLRNKFDQSSAAISPQSDIIRQRLEDAIARVEAAYHETQPISDLLFDERTPHMPKELPMTETVANPQPKKSNSSMLIAGAAVAIFAISGGWYALSGSLDSDFTGSAKGFSANLDGAPIDTEASGPFSFANVDGTSVLTVTGPATIATSEAVPIDTSKTYIMKVRVRVARDAPTVGGANLYAGVATFDAQGNLQKEAPGTHRYFVAADKLSAADGWREFEGTITGVGNESHKTFRDGTATAKPIVLVNFNSPGAVTEIDYVHFKECENPQDCKLDPPK